MIDPGRYALGEGEWALETQRQLHGGGKELYRRAVYGSKVMFQLPRLFISVVYMDGGPGDIHMQVTKSAPKSSRDALIIL